ncbi:putative ribosome biogenesis protein [Phaeomoniella chlamydospora]|uniref:Ribosome assembly protein 1 n=1 Tax=Phaeomoniella chlamydospora TaxID=158046 RepID=A0A0G2EPB9_PHACM|nr:putative ribosome biogenesis protein [Phaeomoniella chlamydospora]
MPVIDPQTLISLQSNPKNIRNICILAHVDHGKTSLTDGLIATNGIISPKLAGKIRYLDSRPDEQLRGITMESSAISLYFSMLRKSQGDPEAIKEEYLINLIDSPGHIDFSSEVSTASRLSDAAVVLVDAVEGVCSQTVTVLRQVWIERLKPILVINKLDRLVTELKMSPAEAYAHLGRILEAVNAVIGRFFQGARMEEDLQWRNKQEARDKIAGERAAVTIGGDDASALAQVEAQFEEKDDEDLYFAPEKNNVIFASAIDGWAFTVRQFAGLYEKKLGIKRAILEKVLWGDFYLDPKTKRVLGQKHLKGRNLKPMFVQLVLESIWAVYNATTGAHQGKGDPALLEKITKSLSITLPPHIMRSKDPRNVLLALFSAWLPLSTAVLVSVIEYLPSPPEAQAIRLPEMIEDSPGSKHVDEDIKDAMVHFKADASAPVVAFVSKMVAIPAKELPSAKLRSQQAAKDSRERLRQQRESSQVTPRANEDGVAAVIQAVAQASLDDSLETVKAEDPNCEHLVGFARLYSGTLTVGDEIYVLAPKFSPAHPLNASEWKKVTITALYLLMGRGLESLQSVPAGAIFGIEGLEGHILKTGTLCSRLQGGINLGGVTMASAPIVRVSLEPSNPADLGKMVRGLKLLEQSDPCAMYEQLPSGEHVILTAGELHLERCLKDLRERFAKCDVQAGQTIVPYRETILETEDMNPPKNKDLPRGTNIAETVTKQVKTRVRVRPLPLAVTEFLIKNVASIRKVYSESKTEQADESNGNNPEGSEGGSIGDDTGTERKALPVTEFKKQLQTVFDELEGDQKHYWGDVVSKISAFGPRRVGPNLLIDATGKRSCKRFFEDESELRNSQILPELGPDFSDTITYAFQLATSNGPLCHEPVQGVAVFLELVTYSPHPGSQSGTPGLNSPPESVAGSEADAASSGRLTGEVITSIRSSISSGFLDWSPRILLALYVCTIQSTTEVIGRVYDVLTRRHGSVLSEDLLEGTPYFTITSLLPVAESFGFSEEIRKRTSGLAQPMLVFSGFGVLEGVNDLDPFWVPKSEEELEDLGEYGDKENSAKKYVDAVRKRKGLLVRGTRGIGRDAEKQKTLKKN